MTEQLELLPSTRDPRLTERQQALLDALTQAGTDGLEPSEAGAILHELKTGRWAHTRDQRCEYCPRDGLHVLKRLRTLGLARYRSGLRVWQTINLHKAQATVEPPSWNSSRRELVDGIPY